MEEYKNQAYDEITKTWEYTIKGYETSDLNGYKASYEAQINSIYEATTKDGVNAVKKELNTTIETVKAYIAAIEYANDVKNIVSAVWSSLSLAVNVTEHSHDYDSICNDLCLATNKDAVDGAIARFVALIEIVESGDVVDLQSYVEYVMEKMFLNWYLLGKSYIDGINKYSDEYSKLVNEVKMLTDYDVSGATKDNVKEKVATIYAKFEALIVDVKNYKPTTAA